MKARCYQLAAIEAVHKCFDAGDQSTLCVIPTGGGKTVVAGMIARDFLAAGRGRVMVVCHRDELIRQAADKFQSITGETCAIEKADEWSNELSFYGAPKVVVASVQSLSSKRGDARRVDRFKPEDFGLLWIDEAHHAVAGTWKNTIGHFVQNPNLKVLGVTATPGRADKQKLGSTFQSVAYEYSLSDIIHDGYLVPIHQRSIVIEGLDFSKVRTTAGDLNAEDLEAAMMFEKPLHGVVYATIELACGLPQGSLKEIADDIERGAKVAAMIAGKRLRKTLVFAVSVAHAERMAEIVNRWIPDSATFVDGSMSQELRRKRLKDYAEGRVQFLFNCMVATEGFDEPGVEVVVMARPTKSDGLFRQMIGRGTRPARCIAGTLGELDSADARRALIDSSEKPFVEILDFVGNSGKHKLISTIDILGADKFCPEELKIAQALTLQESMDVEEALQRAKEELNRRRKEAEKKRREREEEAERQLQMIAARRAQLVGTADYAITQVDGFDRHSPSFNRHQTAGGSIDQWTRQRLERAKIPAEVINKLTPERAKELSREVARRWKNKLCSYPQAEVLRRAGYSKSELHDMTREAASAAIERVKANGWRRPKQEAAA